jgi:hypothetical protein
MQKECLRREMLRKYIHKWMQIASGCPKIRWMDDVIKECVNELSVLKLKQTDRNSWENVFNLTTVMSLGISLYTISNAHSSPY